MSFKQAIDNANNLATKMCLRIKGIPENVTVDLLDGRTLSYSFTRNQKAQELFDSVFEYMSLEETEYFGICFIGWDGLQQWLESDKLILNQLAGKDKDDKSHRVQFRIRFYASDPTSPDHELTRYLFYLQVKRDIFTGRLKLPERKASALFAYILQAELGDFDAKRDTLGYASEFQILPHQTEQIELAASRKHMTLQGMSHGRAETQVLNRIKWLDTYGLESYPALGNDHRRYRFGFTPTGLIVYKKDLVICEYFWPRLTHCNYKHQTIHIHVLSDKDSKSITKSYSFLSEKRAKLTWKQCLKYRSFFQSKMYINISKKERRFLDNSWSSVYSRMNSFSESIASVQTFEPPVERVQSARRTRRSYSVDVTESHQNERKSSESKSVRNSKIEDVYESPIKNLNHHSSRKAERLAAGITSLRNNCHDDALNKASKCFTHRDNRSSVKSSVNV